MQCGSAGWEDDDVLSVQLEVPGTRSFCLCLRLFLEGKGGECVITVCSCFENGKYCN